jgi:sugar lactone lactonase YvrE
VDVEGGYWVAMYEGGRLLRLAPDGSIAAEFEVPACCPTMPCFGGPDGRTLYLTSARKDRSAEEMAAWPDSGCVFAARVDVPGLPTNFFIPAAQ